MNYRSETQEGRTLRSSTLFLKDEEDVAVGCICINVDLTSSIEMRDFFTRHFIGVEDGGEDASGSEEVTEIFSHDVSELKKELVKRAIQEVGVPVSLMRKEHKLQVVKALDRDGLFLIRGAAEYVAQALGVTRYTIYNYRDSVRTNEELKA